jgi:tRNA-Thr(GGU) m(6)t(6)A37 methyltransferase TsaA
VDMDSPLSFEISPIGFVRSTLRERSGAPRQSWEDAPLARLEILPVFVEGLDGIESGQEIWILTWLHEAQRSTLTVRPRRDPRNPLTGVFATRSPDRPNPIGLHRAKILSIADGRWIELDGLEAIDGTPIVDIKPVLERKDF